MIIKNSGVFMNESKISKIIGKTIYQYKMIQPNDRVLVAVSGGKDSLLLLQDLAHKQRVYPFKFELFALHVRMDFCDYPCEDKLIAFFEKIGVPYKILDVAMVGRLKPEREMNCFWCASQRRMELIKFARENNYNRIALGHHLDDIIETYLMNILYKGELSTMLPRLDYDKYPLSIIRPLANLFEQDIAEYAASHDLVINKYICPYSLNSKRLEMKKTIEMITKNNRTIKKNIFNSMQNVNNDYLL